MWGEEDVLASRERAKLLGLWVQRARLLSFECGECYMAYEWRVQDTGSGESKIIWLMLWREQDYLAYGVESAR